MPGFNHTHPLHCFTLGLNARIGILYRAYNRSKWLTYGKTLLEATNRYWRLLSANNG